MARVLYIHTQALRADSPHARATFQMLHLLRRAGLEVDVLTLPGGDPWPQGLATRLFRTLHVPFARTLPPYGTGLRRRWATAVMALAAARLLLTNHYDAVHCADRSVRLGVLLAWLFGVRLVFEWRVASGYDLASWARPRGRRFLRAVGMVFTDTPCRAADLRGSPLLGRVAAIPPLPAPCVEPLPPPPARPCGAAQSFRLAALSLDGTWADLAPLLGALPRLLDHTNVRVDLAGGTPAAAERLRRDLARRLPPAAAVGVRAGVTGPEDLMAFTGGADLLFLPAVCGPLPPPELLDAMAARRAILAVRCPAHEALLTADNAMLVPADTRAVAAAVLRHLWAPFLCAEHAVAAAETVARERAYPRFAETVRRCYTLALEREEP